MDLRKNQSDIALIFKLSWPVMLGMVFQSLLSTVDVYFISNLGTDQSAAASLATSVTNVIFVFSTLVSAGTIALVSRSKGEGNSEAIQSISGQSLSLSAIIGALLGLVCFALRQEMIVFIFNPSPEVLDYTNEYLTVIFPATMLVFLNSALRTIFQADGDTKTPLYIFGISNVINAIGDYILIEFMGMGVTGAALATVFSMMFSFAAINIKLIKRLYDSKIKAFFLSLRMNLKDTIRILRIGGWACIQNLARPLTGTLMYSLVYSTGGKEGAAAFGIGGQLFNYNFIILVGLSTGLDILIGQNLGRGDIKACDRLIKQGMKVAGINVIICIIPYILLPRVLMAFFIDNPAVIAHGADYLRVVYLGIISIPFTMVYGGVFQGAGDTFPPMIASMLANVALKLPVAYLLAKVFDLGTMGAWIAIAISVVAESLVIFFLFKQNKWKNIKI